MIWILKFPFNFVKIIMKTSYFYQAITNIFNRRLSRVANPITSHWAANEVKEFKNQHYEHILSALQRYGALGKDGIARQSGLDSNQVSRRMNELQFLGFVGLTGRLTKSNFGRWEREWECKPLKENK